jgi:CheY-like chemotaxis protein
MGRVGAGSRYPGVLYTARYPGHNGAAHAKDGCLSVSSAPRPSPAILVVDDQADIRDIVALVLSDEGYAVQTAANGQEALDSIRQQPPSLVLLDLQMPVMTGWDVVDKLRAEGLPVPVVFMSAGIIARAEAERVGVAGYLSKPFDLDDLLGVVERCRV